MLPALGVGAAHRCPVPSSRVDEPRQIPAQRRSLSGARETSSRRVGSDTDFATNLRPSPQASAGTTSREVPVSPSHPMRPVRETGRQEEITAC